MRNLKRALSLTLASVMLLGMMVVGASAASYPDVDDEKNNVEAIDVLNAVGVMVGYEDNTFQPDKQVTRNEMAVVMAKLLLGTYEADSYVGSHPFTDVPSWADKYVAACYASGIVAGRGNGIYDGTSTVTAVEAAAMMLRALGYEDLSKGADRWDVPVAGKANEINLFKGLTGGSNTPMDRNAVAQLALNTLQANVVKTDKEGGIDVPGVVTIPTKITYSVMQSNDRYAYAIDTTLGTANGGSNVQMGEQLYKGDLTKSHDTDDFGRPCRTWRYDGKDIGTYVRYDLMRAEYTEEVTSSELYNLLGAATLKDEEIKMDVYVDGETVPEVNTIGTTDPTTKTGVFGKGDVTRNGKNALGRTGNGVLTQVFVETNRGNELITVSIINTYLAKASADYNDRKSAAPLTVYGVAQNSAKDQYVKNPTKFSGGSKVVGTKIDVDAYSEDFPMVEDAKKDDIYLVTLAKGSVQSIVAPDTVDAVTLNSFKKFKSVSSDTTYDYSSSTTYNEDVLDEYDQSNMKNTTYKLYLDEYGYMIGIEIVDEDLNYVFITGYEKFGSNITGADAQAFAIFTDGTTATITVKDAGKTLESYGSNKVLDTDKTTKDDEPWDGTKGNPQLNAWYTYTTDKNDKYALTLVHGDLDVDKNKAAQGVKDRGTWTIDKANIALKSPGSRAYGDNDSIYLTAKQTDLTIDKSTVTVINGVRTRTVGVNNVNIALTAAPDTGLNQAYYLYNNKGYIIAAVVLGEDNGSTKDYAFIIGDIEQEDYKTDDDEWVWYRKAIIDGEEVTLRERGSTQKYLNNLSVREWYRVTFDSDEYVVSVEAKSNTANSWTKKKVDFTTDNNVENIYINGADEFKGTTLPKVDTDKVVLVKQDMSKTNSNQVLELSNHSLYAWKKDFHDSGIHITTTAKAATMYQLDDDWVVEYCGSGTGDANVEAAMRYLEGKTFNGSIYYVMDKGEATTVIFKDNDPRTTPGVTTNPSPRIGKVELVYGVGDDAVYVKVTGTDGTPKAGTFYYKEYGVIGAGSDAILRDKKSITTNALGRAKVWTPAAGSGTWTLTIEVDGVKSDPFTITR